MSCFPDGLIQYFIGSFIGFKPTPQKVLQDFANELTPCSKYTDDGDQIANKLFNILQSNRNDVDRLIIADSCGKGNRFRSCPDFDLVIFLNYKEPPFETVLNEIRVILEREKAAFKNYRFINQTDISITFEAFGYKFELRPASNCKIWLLSTQKEGTWKKIRELPNPQSNGRLYSSGFAEDTSLFVKQQSDFVNSVVRLAKYWNAQINIPDCYIEGRSLMIQLMAMKACEKVSNNNIYQACTQFLTDVVNFDKQTIYFEKYYKKSEIPSSILNYSGPVILDPVNYYHNLADRRNISEKAVSILRQAAKHSLNQIQTWVLDPNGTLDSFEDAGIFTSFTGGH